MAPFPLAACAAWSVQCVAGGPVGHGTFGGLLLPDRFVGRPVGQFCGSAVLLRHSDAGVVLFPYSLFRQSHCGSVGVESGGTSGLFGVAVRPAVFVCPALSRCGGRGVRLPVAPGDVGLRAAAACPPAVWHGCPVGGVGRLWRGAGAAAFASLGRVS